VGVIGASIARRSHGEAKFQEDVLAESNTEIERLRTLRSYEILDTEEEEIFDDFTYLVSTYLDVPIALISLVDKDRQWFKSYLGLEVRETHRDIAFCDSAIQSPSLMIVPNALQDERFSNNPLVLSDPNIRFYAGAPLVSREGHAIGTLCAIDTKARELNTDQQRVLSTLARQVMGQLELRRVTNRNLRRQIEHLEIEQKLQEQQRMESLAVLAGGVAHDFNNLLVSILGNAGLAKLELPPESSAHPIIDKIETAAKNAGELTKQLDAYSGERAVGEYPQLNMSSLVGEIGHLLDVVISRKVVLNLDLEEQNVTFKGDPIQIRQVIMNLLINASEAIGSRSGNVNIRTGFQKVTQEYLKQTRFIGSVREGEFVFVEVADTGDGMTGDVRDRMFDPFFTTKDAGKGLGLAAVLGIVASHEGAIQVYTQPHKGSTIKVLLPASDQIDEKIATPLYQMGNGELILVVDDEEHVKSVTTAMLERCGYTTVMASNGAEAIDVFKNNSKIALVLMDITMPKLNGVDASKAILKLDPSAHIILMSGHVKQELSKSLPGHNIAAFLQKPFATELLIETISSTIAMGSKATKALADSIS